MIKTNVKSEAKGGRASMRGRRFSQCKQSKIIGRKMNKKSQKLSGHIQEYNGQTCQLWNPTWVGEQ